MKSRHISLFTAVLLLALCGAAFARPGARIATARIARATVARAAVANAAQPDFSQAIMHLEKAKRAERPIEHLEKAKNELHDARRNKRGETVEALKHVQDAIGAARKHEQKAMEGHINAAIRDIREGRRAASR